MLQVKMGCILGSERVLVSFCLFLSQPQQVAINNLAYQMRRGRLRHEIIFLRLPLGKMWHIQNSSFMFQTAHPMVLLAPTSFENQWLENQLMMGMVANSGTGYKTSSPGSAPSRADSDGDGVSSLNSIRVVTRCLQTRVHGSQVGLHMSLFSPQTNKSGR